MGDLTFSQKKDALSLKYNLMYYSYVSMCQSIVLKLDEEKMMRKSDKDYNYYKKTK